MTFKFSCQVSVSNSELSLQANKLQVKVFPTHKRFTVIVDFRPLVAWIDSFKLLAFFCGCLGVVWDFGVFPVSFSFKTRILYRFALSFFLFISFETSNYERAVHGPPYLFTDEEIVHICRLRVTDQWNLEADGRAFLNHHLTVMFEYFCCMGGSQPSLVSGWRRQGGGRRIVGPNNTTKPVTEERIRE